MAHTCDLCEREATVHEVVVRHGKRVERHLCEEHAKELGIIQAQSHTSVAGLVQSFVVSKSGASRERQAARSACPTCGLTFAEFRKEGLLGCPDCYAAFEDKLGPLLERAHDGGDHHVGKVPKRAGSSLERQAQLTSMRRELQAAIEHEEYERAAKIRDDIATLESATAAGDEQGDDAVSSPRPSVQSPAELRRGEDDED
jgi:protein arginine kinase activator